MRERKEENRGKSAKVLHIGSSGAIARYSDPGNEVYRNAEITDLPRGRSVEEYIDAGKDAQFLIADAIQEVPARLIEGLPNLLLIHSEGAAFNLIDTRAAAERGIYVCNSAGMNAHAVAEQAVLLMLGCLRDVAGGDRAVREGRQILVKEEYIRSGSLQELSDLSVGLVGFGHIARETARLLAAFGVEDIRYYKRHPLGEEEERAFHVRYLPLDALLAQSDIVSLHLPVNDATKGMADAEFFGKMKDGSYFINTARGELVEDAALATALRSGKLRMAGLDTLDGEPVGKDHCLLQERDIQEKLLLSPHIGGITASSFKRSYAMIWDDIGAVLAGERPERVVNGV